MARLKTYRVRQGSLWITFYLENCGFAWNLGLSICRTKRGSNDWYHNRKNKRAKNIGRLQNNASLKDWAKCVKLLRTILIEHKEPIFIYVKDLKRATMGNYLKRFGFEPTSNDIWVRL